MRVDPSQIVVDGPGALATNGSPTQMKGTVERQASGAMFDRKKRSEKSDSVRRRGKGNRTQVVVQRLALARSGRTLRRTHDELQPLLEKDLHNATAGKMLRFLSELLV